LRFFTRSRPSRSGRPVGRSSGKSYSADLVGEGAARVEPDFVETIRATARPSTLPFPHTSVEKLVKLTGERPMEGATPDSLLALHDAGYREVIARLGTGTVLDVGCGVGDETIRLTASGRRVIGVDYDPPTAIAAQARLGRSEPDEGLTFAAMDGARVGLRDGSVDYVCSSHIIEHFVNPERHVAELARVLAPGGSAFVLTPNAPADFENPFHVYLFEPDQLRSLLGLFFEDVEVLGLDGSPELKADFAARRASGERILKLDVFQLRRRMPRSWYVGAYTRALPVVYKVLGRNSGIGSGLDDSHFFVTDEIATDTPVLFAVARRPRPSVGPTPG
jgi:SAM-dependent methyltransferase